MRELKHFSQGDELATFSQTERKYGAHILDVDDTHPANCIISGPRASSPYESHMPMLDDDQGVFRVVPSRTPGHHHVYIDKAIEWRDYVELLRLMSRIGLIDRAWAELSIQQGTATLRLPA